MDAYCLFFIHYETRKVFCCYSTVSPNAEWVLRQAKNAMMFFEDLGIYPRFLIRDNDGKFTPQFDQFFKNLFESYHSKKDTDVILTPIKAPNMNCYAESFVKSIKRECLDYFICFGLGHLDYIVQSWMDHYLHERPHQGKGIGNATLDDTIVRLEAGTIVRKEILGGLINKYRRVA